MTSEVVAGRRPLLRLLWLARPLRGRLALCVLAGAASGAGLVSCSLLMKLRCEPKDLEPVPSFDKALETLLMAVLTVAIMAAAVVTVPMVDDEVIEASAPPEAPRDRS